jgi:adenine-specific DNA-methyltransferase
MNKVLIGDNLKNLNNILEDVEKKFKIVYFDPPYNTGNVFKYDDNLKSEEWSDSIKVRINLIKESMSENSVFICSISEEELFNIHQILKDNFKYVFEPLIWLTKNPLNQNKVTNISSVCHEYILIASDYNIKSKDEEFNIENLKDEEFIKNKLKRYPLKIKLLKEIEQFETLKIDGKEIIKIEKKDYIIEKSIKIEESYKKHFYQKRTAQNGHGSQRYVDLVKKDLQWDSETLYFIKGVKDKYNLNGKFILNNSYFQSISDVVKLKLPSFLGFYQSGINGFQTAKPITLMERIFKLFSEENDYIMDFYGGSGNVSIAINNINRKFYTFEQGTIKELKNNNNNHLIINRLKEYNIDFEVQYD